MKQIDWVKELEEKERLEEQKKPLIDLWKYYRVRYNYTGAGTTASSWKIYSGTGDTA